MKYTFKRMRRHTEIIRADSKPLIVKTKKAWIEAVENFSAFFQRLENTPKSLERNVKMVLSTRFFNHVYSSFILAESGLISDAITCERSAIEVLAAYKLICAKPDLAEKYNNGKFLKPYEVRHMLEQLGYPHEKEAVKGIYSQASGIAHVNRDHERFSMKWESPDDVLLYIGGHFEETDVAHMIDFLPVLIDWFLMPMGKSANDDLN